MEKAIMSEKRILSVGQCGADHGALARTLRQHFQAEVVVAHSASEALNQLRQEPFALVLVNRVFDADGSSGLEFIRQLKAEEDLRQHHVMLVSNYEDAQQQAVAAGAEPGFGKAALGHSAMLSRVKRYLG
jgi:two-component system chemotaxis response regulator CheY